jgi:inorganic triphosphatase YgiF
VFTEIELKLQLSPDSVPCLLRQPLLKSFSASHSVTRRFYSIYYDTPDMDLRHSGLALRLRRVGRRWFQTIKGGGAAAAGLHQRSELEAQVLKAQPDFTKITDPSLARLFAPSVLREQLRPLFVTDFNRAARLLRFPDGSEAEFCLDRGKIIAGGSDTPVCELELELRSGSISALFQFALDLLHSVPFRLENVSKAERGYALATGSWSPPAKAVPVQLRAGMGTGEAFSAIVWNCLGQLHGNEAGMLQGHDIEYLHQMRVGLRRLRSSMNIFSRVYPDISSGLFVHELKWLSGTLNSARDWDVFVAEVLTPVNANFPGHPGLEELQDRCERRRRYFNQEARHAVESQRYTKLMLSLSRYACTEGWSEPFPSGPGHSVNLKPEASVKEFAAALLERRRRQLTKYGKKLAGIDEAGLHVLRIVIKKHRYAAEFFACIYPHKKTRRYIQSLSVLQDILGAMNDAVNAKRLLGEVSLENDGKDLREAIGIMLGWGARPMLYDKERFTGVWNGFMEAEPFW